MKFLSCFILTAVLCLILTCSYTTADSYAECENLQDRFISYAEDCQAYIYCDGEDSFIDECPQETYFDAEREECAFDDDLRCYNQKQQQEQQQSELESAENAIEEEADNESFLPSTVAELISSTAAVFNTTLPTPVTDVAPPKSPRPTCQQWIDESFPHPLRCEYYYRCIAGYLTIARCEWNAAWDYLKEQCVPKEEAVCYKESAN